MLRGMDIHGLMPPAHAMGHLMDQGVNQDIPGQPRIEMDYEMATVLLNPALQVVF
jgi:hypothetical protein